MKIHEYQAKEIFRNFGIPVPEGRMVRKASEAKKAAEAIGKKVVVKAQILAGGRGGGGGIKRAETPLDAEAVAREILGMTLITHQTGPEGKRVCKVLVEEALEVERELYIGMVIDRERSCIAVIASEEGGMEIEVVAAKSPERIVKECINPRVGLASFQTRKIVRALHFPKRSLRQGTSVIQNLYRLLMEKDASLVEINPLVITRDGKLVSADAKISFDDNALYRHPEIAALQDIHEEEPMEAEAFTHRLSYIKLNGNIGCMVNGAGLAMATMDIIHLYGGVPANFLDIGGAASSERVEQAFRILLSDAKVKAVLITIFGGIVRCDRVAIGVVDAVRRLHVTVPVVVRLAGTNCDLAADILNKSGLTFRVANDLADAAEKVVAAVKE